MSHQPFHINCHRLVMLWRVLAFLSLCFNSTPVYARHSLSSARLLASTSSYTSTLEPVPAVSSTTTSSPNVVLQLFGYVKNSVVRTVDGCGLLWSNHGRCKEIRQKIKHHRNELKQSWENNEDLSPNQRLSLVNSIPTNGAGAISFDEYLFLQKGKEDRSKVLSLCFLMFSAPKFLPYALMLNPDMLPTPFQTPSATGESSWTQQSRERSRAVVECLLNIEQRAKVVPALAKLNIFGQAARERNKQTLTTAAHYLADLLLCDEPASATTTSSKHSNEPHNPLFDNAQRVLTVLDPWLYQTEEFSKSQDRLCHVPAVMVKGVCSVLGGGGGWLSNLQPHFLTRGRLLSHLRKVEDADDFLFQSSTSLSSLSESVLLDACSDRLCVGPGCTRDELRQNLDNWLTFTVRQPAERLQQHQQQQHAERLLTKSTSENENNIDADSVASDQDDEDTLHFNGNLARMALMGYYGCAYTRDPRSASVLPRLLFTGASTSTSSAASNQGDNQQPQESKRAQKRFRVF